MAVYTTFFMCRPEDLAGGFPTFRPPSPHLVRHEFVNPFTGEMMTVESHEPEWPVEDASGQDYTAVAIEGCYEDYLEGRLPPFVRSCPHWAAKGFLEEELETLAEALGVEPQFSCPLYAPPSSALHLQELPAELPARLSALDSRNLEAVTSVWAVAMNWELEETADILQRLVTLAGQGGRTASMYVLTG